MNFLTVAATVFKGKDTPVTFAPEKIQDEYVTKKRSFNGTLLVDKINITEKQSWTLSYPVIERATYDDWLQYNLTTQTISSDTHDINGSYFITVSDPSNESGELLYGVNIQLDVS